MKENLYWKDIINDWRYRIFKESKQNLGLISGVGSFFLKEFNQKECLLRAEKELEFIEKNNSKLCDNFGQSIHYCNLRINKIPINQIMKKIHPNIYGIGMSFIDQDVPGPISNDIILDSYKKTINI